VNGSGRLCWAITNTMLFQVIRLSCASFGGAFSSVAANVHRCDGSVAAEAADNGLLAPELAQGISRVKGVKSTGLRVHARSRNEVRSKDGTGDRSSTFP
jgi:hypothetical protein